MDILLKPPQPLMETTWGQHGDNMGQHEDNVETTWGPQECGDHMLTTWGPHGYGDHVGTTWRQHEDNVKTTWDDMGTLGSWRPNGDCGDNMGTT